VIPIAPGDKRHLITIQKVTITQDEIGNEIKSWSTFAKVSADVKDLSGREYFAAKQSNSESTVKITIRFLPGIDSTMRILYQDRVLQLEAPPLDPDGRRRDYILMCKDWAEGES
jgi:SPP1 family predicted phage head-tail adaptor